MAVLIGRLKDPRKPRARPPAPKPVMTGTSVLTSCGLATKAAGHTPVAKGTDRVYLIPLSTYVEKQIHQNLVSGVGNGVVRGCRIPFVFAPRPGRVVRCCLCT